MNISNLNRSFEFLNNSSISKYTKSLAVICGSGLAQSINEYADVIERFTYTEIPNFPIPKVGGHTGELLVINFKNTNILALVFSGRVHLYEGFCISDVLFQVRLAKLLNINTIVITCASGSLNRNSLPGELGLITDQIDLQSFSKTTAGVEHNPIYDNELANTIYEIALKSGIPIRRGTLCAVLGPSYETPAEANIAKICGADWMSMSTIKETAEASALGLKVVGITGVTNYVNDSNMSHDHVLKSALDSSKHLWALLSATARGGLYGKE